MNLTVIIPSLNPDEKLLLVVNAVREKGYDDIILVNDGSDSTHLQPFLDAEQLGCVVLTHEVNKGKGRALKTAFEYYLSSGRTNAGVITVDGDNQHSADDITACEKALIDADGKTVILGCRDFSQDDVPFRSRAGNNITSFVFTYFCGLRISDTQTGLRAIPRAYIKAMCETAGERFEYETNMLLELKRLNIPISEVKIRTIYIDENATTHFNPIRDSIKIYGVIFKFFFSSILSFLLDYGLFNLLYFILGTQVGPTIREFISTAVARVCSSLFNFTLNRRTVFKNTDKLGPVMGRYYILAAAQLLCSFLLLRLGTFIFNDSQAAAAIIKIVVDVMLYFISFRIQKDWVFKTETKADNR